MNYAEQVKIILLEEFVKARSRNPAYSMRAYSARIGVAQSVVSELLSGKRPITLKTAQRILRGLALEPAEIERVLNATEETRGPRHAPLDADSFYLIADWYHPAILSLAHTEGFRGNPQWVATRLGISPTTAKEAILRLLRLNLLKREGGKVLPTGAAYSAISPTPSLALRRANEENLALAEKALTEVPVEDRDFTALTLCFDPDRLADARRMIKTFRQNFDRVMESGRKKEVYKLCVQLFPLTKTPGKTS